MNPNFCRYGYGSAEFYYQILDGYDNASIPLETFVSDSQYMDYDQDFTLGSKFQLKDMVVRTLGAKTGNSVFTLGSNYQLRETCLCVLWAPK